MSASLRALRHDARGALMRRRGLYLAYSRLKHPDRTVGRSTEIVIEGARRSANTFAVAAFELAQSRPVAVAHHRHASAQVLEGVRRGLPVVVLVRDPCDAVCSAVAHHEGRLSSERALREHVAFHEGVLPVRGSVVVAPFELVVSDFGAVVRAVNARFGTDFGVFEHTEENVARCFARIEAEHARRFGRTIEERIARPSPRRAAGADERRAAYALLPAALRERAAELHALYTTER